MTAKATARSPSHLSTSATRYLADHPHDLKGDDARALLRHARTMLTAVP